jgi:multiple sugar transport system ATP-binding protein
VPVPVPSGVTGLDAATVSYPDGSVALRAVTLLAEPGEVLAVLGPSGSGKSSLLRAIAGLVRLSAGQVLINGMTTTEPTERRNVAMVFEHGQLLPFLDVARNVSFGLDLERGPADRSRERVEEQARGLNLISLLRRSPASLSRGERARVGVARALVRAPRAFLLDEPLAHVDAGERRRMREHISDTVRRAGVTTLFVTHDQTEAMSIGDRVAVLNSGTVAQVARPRELYDFPADTFVADFIGATPIGLLPATLVVADGMAGYRIDERTLPTWAAVPAALDSYRDQPILLGFRAEDVHEAPRPEHRALTGVVTTLEVVGAHALVRIRVGERLLSARFDRRTDARPGATVTVGVDATRAHVFDPATLRAIAHPEIE